MTNMRRVYDFQKAYQDQYGHKASYKVMLSELDLSRYQIQNAIRKLFVEKHIKKCDDKRYQFFNPPNKLGEKRPWPKDVVQWAIREKLKGKRIKEISQEIEALHGRRCSSGTICTWMKKHNVQNQNVSLLKVLIKHKDPWNQANHMLNKQKTPLIEVGLFLESTGEPQWMIDSALLMAWTTGNLKKPVSKKAKETDWEKKLAA